jgi:hypothetical protein
MDKTALVEKDIKDGETLIKALDKTDFQVHSALWFYLPESDEWRFIIASPLIDKEGPIKAYTYVRKELAKLSPPVGISLKNISIFSPNNDLIKLLKVAITTGPGISGVRFTRNVINNVFIEDVYIYRIQ